MDPDVERNLIKTSFMSSILKMALRLQRLHSRRVDILVEALVQVLPEAAAEMLEGGGGGTTGGNGGNTGGNAGGGTSGPNTPPGTRIPIPSPTPQPPALVVTAGGSQVCIGANCFRLPSAGTRIQLRRGYWNNQ